MGKKTPNTGLEGLILGLTILPEAWDKVTYRRYPSDGVGAVAPRRRALACPRLIHDRMTAHYSQVVHSRVALPVLSYFSARLNILLYDLQPPLAPRTYFSRPNKHEKLGSEVAATSELEAISFANRLNRYIYRKRLVWSDKRTGQDNQNPSNSSIAVFLLPLFQSSCTACSLVKSSVRGRAHAPPGDRHLKPAATPGLPDSN